MSSKKVIKAGLGYTIGNFLIKGVNFAVLPVFSRIMTAEEFGMYNIFISYDAILFILIGLALHSSIKSANYTFKGIDEYTSSISIVYIINGIIFLVVITIWGDFIGEVLGFSKPILYMLVLYGFGSAVLTLYNNRISLEYSYKKYLVIALVNSVGNVAFSLFLVLTVLKNQKAMGRILGSTSTIFVISLVLLYRLYKKAMPRFAKRYWGFGITYSLPIIPHGLSQVLLSQSDRIMISRMDSNAAAGIYSLAGNIQLVLTLIVDSVSTVWSTWFFEQISKGEKNNIQEKAKILIGGYAILAVGLMSVTPEIVSFLGGEEYGKAKYVAIPMIVSSFFVFLYNLVVASEYYTKKTKYIMYGTILAAMINLVLNYIFILKYGYIAAAYTTLCSYACYLSLHIILSKCFIKFNVIRIQVLLFYSLVIGTSAVVNLLFVNVLLWRCIICATIVTPLMAKIICSIRNDKGNKL